jgi:serine/threonine protein kinase
MKKYWSKGTMTDHVLSFLSAYQGTLSQALPLPDALSKAYELYDCLRETPNKSTFLLKKKFDDSFAILKVAKNSAREHLRAEYEILSRLHSPRIPQALSYISDQGTDYFLRAYVAGTPISDYVEQNGAFSESESARLIAGLCETLALLHAQTPPVIHRDIKPQNIIYTSQHTLALIDFDAARYFQPEQKKDTVCLGTQTTAAPEQFGYQQTDARADIYSTGILLLFLCTGFYALESLAEVKSRTLMRVIETSTRFDPQRRYKNIHALSRALSRTQRASATPAVSFWRGAALGLVAGVVLSMALVFSGLLPTRAQADATEAEVPIASPLVAALPAEDQAIVFVSPKIERAVREQLGVDASTPLYQADLDRVDKLFLVGDDTLESWGDVTFRAVFQSELYEGTITTLADIPKLRNLTELAICAQEIIDLTPLKDMHLTHLALSTNLIIDPSPLSSIKSLRELYIGHNPITQINVAAELPLLQVLDLSGSNVSDLSVLGNDILVLCLYDTPVYDFTPLLRMSTLQRLYINHPTQACLNILSQLHDLRELQIGNGVADIEPLLKMKNLVALAIAPVDFTSIEGIQTLDRLEYLRIETAQTIDLSPLTKISALNTLDIVNQEMADYSILFKITNLTCLYCSQAQKDAIEALRLPVKFEIHVV